MCEALIKTLEFFPLLLLACLMIRVSFDLSLTEVKVKQDVMLKVITDSISELWTVMNC